MVERPDNGFLSGFPSTVGAALVGLIRTHLPLPVAIAIAPVAVVATRRIVNMMLTSLIANARWRMPIVPTFTAKISTDIVEEAAEVTCFIPIAVGTVILPRRALLRSALRKRVKPHLRFRASKTAPIPIIITTAAMTGKINPFPAEADVLTEEIGLTLFEKFVVKEIVAVSDSELELPPAEVTLAEDDTLG